MNIVEKFVSIQGEGHFQGYPTAFIRCYGCSLRCRWCDSKYAYFEQGKEEKILDIVKWVKDTGAEYVCITGGEPMLQEGAILTLLDLLVVETDCAISIETNGNHSLKEIDNLRRPGSLDGRVSFTMDWKMPSSGMYENAIDSTLNNLQYLRSNFDEVKFVIADETDYHQAKVYLRDIPDGVGIIFSPVFIRNPADRGGLNEFFVQQIAAWMIRDRLMGIKFQLQLHKIIWPDRLRGV